MTTIIDGKKIRDEILANIKEEIASLSFKPIFCDILVGNNKTSIQYVEMKKQKAEFLGINFMEANFKETITTEELVEEIKVLNKIPNMCGIIAQLPLPGDIDRRKILDTIDPKLDVDCLGTIASEEFYNGKTDFGFPTALACIKLLNSTQISLKEKNIVILGQGELVGKPVTALLQFQGLNPITVRSTTENKEKIIKEADVIISGMGQGQYITGDMIKNGAIVIDAGTSESNAGIVGDIDFESVNNIASFISPVPGGVGPVTIAMLFTNILNVAKNKL